jgi:hypothetical protein
VLFAFIYKLREKVVSVISTNDIFLVCMKHMWDIATENTKIKLTKSTSDGLLMVEYHNSH